MSETEKISPGTALYYPYIHPREIDHLKAALIYWDRVRRIVARRSGDTILIFQDHLHPANAAPSKPVFLKHLETRFTESALRSLDNLRFPALA